MASMSERDDLGRLSSGDGVPAPAQGTVSDRPNTLAKAESPPRWSAISYAPTVIAIYTFTFNSVAFTVFSYLECNDVYVNGQRSSFVYLYPSIDCNSNEYRTYLPLIYAVLCFELLLIPLGILYLFVWVHRRYPHHFTTQTSVFYRVFANLFLPFQSTKCFWEVWTIFRRTALVAVASLSAASSDSVRLIVSTLLCVLFLCLQLVLQPFFGGAENFVEASSLGLLSLLGFTLLSLRYPLSSNELRLVSLIVVIPSATMICWIAVSKRANVSSAAQKFRAAMTGAWSRTAGSRSIGSAHRSIQDSSTAFNSDSGHIAITLNPEMRSTALPGNSFPVSLEMHDRAALASQSIEAVDDHNADGKFGSSLMHLATVEHGDNPGMATYVPSEHLRPDQLDLNRSTGTVALRPHDQGFAVTAVSSVTGPQKPSRQGRSRTVRAVTPSSAKGKSMASARSGTTSGSAAGRKGAGVRRG